MIVQQPSCVDDHESGALPVDRALHNVLDAVSTISAYEQVDLSEACGRTLHETVFARFDIPCHDNAAMDGYAIRSGDIPDQGFRELTVIGHVYAGQTFTGLLQEGQCIRITTGAPIPEGADTVLMQEHVNVVNDTIRIGHRHRAGENIRRAGENIKQGEAVLKPGKWLTPADIGLLASLGIAEIKVRRKLRIAIASTGDELYAIGERRANGGIYDSNRHSLRAALTRADIEISDLGILADDPAILMREFNAASQYADLIISSGGVSVGDADYTKTVLQSSGRIDFWKVAIKPGRPLAFGSLNDCIFFGLPGNPVAVLVSFYLFVLPAIEKMLGIGEKPLAPSFSAISGEHLRKKPGRTEVVRGIIERNPNGEWQVKTTGKQSSADLRSMSRANAFIILEHDRSDIEAGERITVLPLAGLMV
ncbi:molybdopterin molybdotransferase MoeA [Methylomarinum vadi]|uniref:molybdopterin molybdotransferase MoeA n=1 Tax=Methylomarinum vadi TaxID=438855 RepID=UPI0004DF6C0D|nr:gephyrin-like molybdotransferase Glp [Methylomarinum vadi]